MLIRLCFIFIAVAGSALYASQEPTNNKPFSTKEDFKQYFKSHPLIIPARKEIPSRLCEGPSPQEEENFSFFVRFWNWDPRKAPANLFKNISWQDRKEKEKEDAINLLWFEQLKQEKNQGTLSTMLKEMIQSIRNRSAIPSQPLSITPPCGHPENNECLIAVYQETTQDSKQTQHCNHIPNNNEHAHKK